MKKIIYLCTYVSLLMLTACTNRYESVFDDSADQRVKKAIEEYRSALLDAPNGWKATIYPSAGGGYTFYFDFDEDGTVTMISDFNTTTSGTSMKGTFVMKGLQRPTLTFDTYSYIHILSDPDRAVNGGENGVGLGSDFEFAIKKQNGDSLTLEGIKRNTEIVMVKASAQERTAYLSGVLEQSITDAINYFSSTPYSYLELNGITFFFYPDNASRLLNTFTVGQNEAVLQASETYAFTPTGFSLKNPVTIGGTTFQEIFWDAAQSKYYILNGTQKLYFQPSIVPPIPLIKELGFLHSFIYMEPQSLDALLPQSFKDIFEQAKNGVAAVPLYGLILDDFSLDFTDTNTMFISYYIHNNQGNYRARYTCTRTFVGNSMKFTVVSLDSNAQVIKDAMKPMTDYFIGHNFQFDYQLDGDNLLAKVTPTDLTGTYFVGYLQ